MYVYTYPDEHTLNTHTFENMYEVPGTCYYGGP